jgi:hypothetical protein
MELQASTQFKGLASYVRKLQRRKEVTTMKYEIPEVTVMAPAINAIQSVSGKEMPPNHDSETREAVSGYEDNEE